MYRYHSDGDRQAHCNAVFIARRKPIVWCAAYCSHLRNGKRVYHSPEICAGHIPTELGRLTAMRNLRLFLNKLSGTPLIAHICRLVNEFTTGLITFWWPVHCRHGRIQVVHEDSTSQLWRLGLMWLNDTNGTRVPQSLFILTFRTKWFVCKAERLLLTS